MIKIHKHRTNAKYQALNFPNSILYVSRTKSKAWNTRPFKSPSILRSQRIYGKPLPHLFSIATVIQLKGFHTGYVGVSLDRKEWPLGTLRRTKRYYRDGRRGGRTHGQADRQTDERGRWGSLTKHDRLVSCLQATHSTDFHRCLIWSYIIDL